MRLIPTSLERIAFLVVILTFMAWLVPDSWRSDLWSGNKLQCNAWLVCWAGMLLLTCMIAGTKRQLLVALAALLVLPALIFMSSDKLVVTKDYSTVGAELTKMAKLSDGMKGLGVISLLVFAASWLVSYPLDRLLRPVWTVDDNVGATGAETEPKNATRKGAFRILLIALAGVFVFQVASNLFGNTFAFSSSFQLFLLPLGLVALWVLACGLICRIRAVWAWSTGVVVSIVSSVAAIAYFVQRGFDVETPHMLTILGVTALVVAIPFLLLGNTRKPLVTKPGLFSLLLVALVGTIAVISSRYDMHTLLLHRQPFDLEQAALAKTLDSNSNVRVSWTLIDPRRGYGELEFEFLAGEGVDSFFSQLDASAFSAANMGSATTIFGMTETVDLSQLSKVKPARIQLMDCRLSSQQLADLFQLGNSLYFMNCKFVPDATVDSGVISGNVNVYSKAPNCIRDFFRAAEGFQLEAGVTISADVVDDEDIKAVLAFVENLDEGMINIRLRGICEFDVDLLRGPSIDRIWWDAGELSFGNQPTDNEKENYAMVLESDIGVNAFIVDQMKCWEILLAARGKFTTRVSVTQSDADYSMIGKFSESLFVFKRNQSQHATALWLPWCDDQTVERSSNIPTLETLSFDVDWISSDSASAAFSPLAPAIVDVTPLNRLQDLEQLHFSSREQVDLSKLTSLKKLKTIQFASSCDGFQKELFPELEEVRVLLDKPIRNGLMKELKSINSLKSLVLIDLHSINFSREKFLQQAVPFLGEQIEIEVVEVEDMATIAPQDFSQYRLDLRKECIKKYLGGSD